MTDAVRRLPSGGPWEATYGYSRAVVAGPTVHLSGCTATVDGEVLHVGDAHAQTLVALQVVADALETAGATLADVVRTRMFVADAADCDAVGRAHGQVFADVRPASTLVVVAALVDPRMLVEIEVEAYLPAGPPDQEQVSRTAG